jgi:hypothetical protein
VTTFTLYAFVAGAALLALWIDTRFPKLAPESFSRRMLAGAVAFVLLHAAPVFKGSVLAVYATLFASVLPAFVATFLAAVWLLRGLREARAGS